MTPDDDFDIVRALDEHANPRDNPPLRVIERGYLRGERVFEKRVRWVRADKAVAELAERHAQAMAAGEWDMVELEFPDCPPDDRFFRIGTNPAGMVRPKFKL